MSDGIPKEIWVHPDEAVNHLTKMFGEDICYVPKADYEAMEGYRDHYVTRCNGLEEEVAALRQELNEDRPYRDMWEASEEERGKVEAERDALRKKLDEAVGLLKDHKMELPEYIKRTAAFLATLEED